MHIVVSPSSDRSSEPLYILLRDSEARPGPCSPRTRPDPARSHATICLNSGWGQGCQVPRTLDRAENLNAKCVRQASRDQSRNQCSMACEIHFLPSCWKTVLQGFILPDFKSDGQPEFGVDRAQRLSLVCSSTPPSEAASLRPGASPRVKLGGLSPLPCSCGVAAYPPLCSAGSI